MVDKNSNGVVYPASDSTEAVIERRIEGIHRMIKVHDSEEETTQVVWLKLMRWNLV